MEARKNILWTPRLFAMNGQMLHNRRFLCIHPGHQTCFLFICHSSYFSCLHCPLLSALNVRHPLCFVSLISRRWDRARKRRERHSRGNAARKEQRSVRHYFLWVSPNIGDIGVYLTDPVGFLNENAKKIWKILISPGKRVLNIHGSVQVSLHTVMCDDI